MVEHRKLKEMGAVSRVARARLLQFLDGAAGDGLISNDISADDLFQELFPHEYEAMGEGKSLDDVLFEEK